VDEAIDAEPKAQAICMQTEDFGRHTARSRPKQKPQFEGN